MLTLRTLLKANRQAVEYGEGRKVPVPRDRGAGAPIDIRGCMPQAKSENRGSAMSMPDTSLLPEDWERANRALVARVRAMQGEIDALNERLRREDATRSPIRIVSDVDMFAAMGSALDDAKRLLQHFLSWQDEPGKPDGAVVHSAFTYGYVRSVQAWAKATFGEH